MGKIAKSGAYASAMACLDERGRDVFDVMTEVKDGMALLHLAACTLQDRTGEVGPLLVGIEAVELGCDFVLKVLENGAGADERGGDLTAPRDIKAVIDLWVHYIRAREEMLALHADGSDIRDDTEEYGRYECAEEAFLQYPCSTIEGVRRKFALILDDRSLFQTMANTHDDKLLASMLAAMAGRVEE